MQKAHAKRHTKHLGLTAILAGALIGLVAVAALTVCVGFAYREHVRHERAASTRYSHILALYRSLHLTSDYVLTDQEIFGDKRVYDWDRSRTYASWRTYTRSADVPATLAELRAAIERAGFVYFDEPYPNSVFKELHFKNSQNEYLRLNIASQPYNDAWRAASRGGYQPSSLPDPNHGPSEVTIKINLDDNNE